MGRCTAARSPLRGDPAGSREVRVAGATVQVVVASCTAGWNQLAVLVMARSLALVVTASMTPRTRVRSLSSRAARSVRYQI